MFTLPHLIASTRDDGRVGLEPSKLEHGAPSGRLRVDRVARTAERLRGIDDFEGHSELGSHVGRELRGVLGAGVVSDAPEARPTRRRGREEGEEERKRERRGERERERERKREETNKKG